MNVSRLVDVMAKKSAAALLGVVERPTTKAASYGWREGRALVGAATKPVTCPQVRRVGRKSLSAANPARVRCVDTSAEP